MSSILKNAAVAAVTRRQPSTFYDRDNRPNPMHQALDKELKLFLGFVKKTTLPGYTKIVEEPYGRPANTLFELWNKYQPCLPPLYYEGKLLEVGEFLVSVKEYKLALWQCYERYLQSYGDINVEQTSDVDSFQTIFYKNGLQAEDVGLMSRAIMGKCICMYHIVKLDDPKLQNRQSLERCLQILSLLRLVMQVVLPKESLCWLVYNGTIHIYTISQHLMRLGHSSRILEYLLWASVCMETSVPLLTVKYLSWRATLYTAVCQCYYDCRAGENAESFARRGLIKIYELSNLELLSSSKSMTIYEDSFRSATIRMAVMVFRRAVFETRRKPKGVLRPKTRANLKDVLNMPWPRTPTESMLADMFEGSSAQFLAILESLNGSNRRILQSSPAAPDSEPEILDAFCELIMAAQEILAGGGGNKGLGLKSQVAAGTSPLTSVTLTGPLIQLATKGEDKIPLESVIRFLKLSYSYEQLDLFEILLIPVLALIKESNDSKFYWDLKALELLSAMGKVNNNWRQKKQTSNIEVEEVEKAALEAQPGKKGKAKLKSADKPIEKLPETVVTKTDYGDDLIQAAVVLMSIISGTYEQNTIEIDLVIDATLFLWNKCKPVFQKYQAGSVDNPRFLQKMENPNREADLLTVVSDKNATDNEGQEEKIEFSSRTPLFAWIYLLDIVHQAVSWCGISSVDPILAAEVGLRLALVYESMAKLDSTDGIKSSQRESRTTLIDSDSVSVGNNPSINFPNQLPMGVPASANENILQAKKILELGLANVNCARRTVTGNEEMNIADVAFIKEFVKNELPKNITEDKINKDEQIPVTLKGTTTTLKNTIKDLHLELMLTYHRVCLKLCAQAPDKLDKPDMRKVKQSRVDKKENPAVNLTENYKDDFSELCNRCNKNYLSKALLLAQRAVILGTEQGPTTEQKKLLEDAVGLIQRVQMEEKRILSENTGANKMNVRSKVPPPPILLCRTDTFMVFRPAPFEPESGEKVAWYRIFVRCASGSNVKVRLSDHYFPGTGEEVSSFNCEMKVTNLEPNERYVFAVAAYTANGKLIGDYIGETTKPFLAFHPLPILMAWAFVSQMAYQVGYYSIANQACSVLWDYFVEKPQTASGATYIGGMNKDFKISLLRLKQRTVDLSSPVLLRQFLNSVFINTDIAIKEGQLFCDIVCDKGILYDRQIQRLHQCECLLVAVELAGWLNEASLALQAVVQIYGLLAPMLYHKIPSISVMQILQKCHSVLLEIPPDMLKKRQSSISDSLSHMIACIIYYVSKALRSWGQKDIAKCIIESGLDLLTSDSDTKIMESKLEGIDGRSESVEKAGKHKKQVLVQKLFNKNTSEGSANVKALELHMFNENQSVVQEHELQGTEDPGMLYAYISCLPSSLAFKEVEKFKSKRHYLEFSVYVAQKGLMEGLTDQVIQWWTDGVKWLAMRNENIIGSQPFINRQIGSVVMTGDDPRKFAAAMVEYKKEKVNKLDKSVPSKINTEKKRAKYKPLRVRPSMSDTSQKRQEEAELKALDTLTAYLLPLHRAKVRSKILRKATNVEMPWRSQMNVIQGLCHFNILLQKLEKRDRMLGISFNRTNYLDQEWFTLETAGVMIVGWNGGPSKDHAALNTLDSTPGLEISTAMTDKQSIPLIELAAAAVIDPSQPVVSEKEIEDIPQTNRSDKFPAKTAQNDPKGPEKSTTLTADVIMESLRKTFIHLKKAMVLAHRGQHWALLQNAARVLWNCANTALLHTCVTNQPGGGSGLITTDMLWTLLWHPFHVAADSLLDMMTFLQVFLKKRVKNKGKIFGDYFESWAGNIQSERGGASLKFDPLLDDVNIVDIRWIRRLTLRTLELLYSQQKYEKLVDIALRFNALTNNRYAEQVLPLIVQAQKLLKKRIMEAGGASPPQPHFKILQAQLGHVIHAKDYLKAQLRVQIDKEATTHIELGGQIDPIGHGAYTKQDAFCLSSVPLDTVVTLQELRDTLDQAHYTARALQHSRKLLCLYLAGQQNLKEGLLCQEPSHVDFKMTTEQPQPTMPPNKITSDFSSTDEIQFFPLPQSQLDTVINSYEKTIEMLQAKNLRGISAQAMHELGNICFLAKNTRAAFNWWCQSLDLVLNTKDAIHTWRSGLQNVEDISSTFLDRCGIWGCLLAGVLSSNIAQYVVTDDDGLRMECCLLSGCLFKALFRSSLPHPKADRDYALYDVGEGCDVTNLMPGLDFTSDRFRCDGRQLVGALKWVTEELSRAQHNIFVLPLLTLNQYFTTYVCRDVQQTVESRILRVRILTDLGLYTEAIIALQQLLNGECLPKAGDSSFRQKEKISDVTYNTSNSSIQPLNLKALGEGKGSMDWFNTCKAIWNKYNYMIIESLLGRCLSFNLSTLFGPHLTCHLALVQAHLFISLANTIPVLPKIDDQMRMMDKYKNEFRTTRMSIVSKPQLPFVADKTPALSKNLDAESDETFDYPSIFSSGNRNVTLEEIKGTILVAAEQTVTSMISVIMEKVGKDKKGIETLSAAELELVVQCQLEQTSIAQQKHHAPMAAHIMLDAMKTLQSACIIKNKKPHSTPLRPTSIKSSSTKENHKAADLKFSQSDNNQFQYQNLQARLRLDTRLWLQCRYELVRSLMSEIRSMGEINEGESKIVSELGDCCQYCAEGLGEAEVCGNLEMQSHFLFLGAQLNLIEGKSLKHTISLLEDAIRRLHLISERSDKGEQLLVSCIMFKTDLEAIAKTEQNSELLTQKMLNNYLDAQKIVLKRMELLGEKIEYHISDDHLSSPISPLQNVYLPYVQRLAELKLRIGHAISRNYVKRDLNNKAADPMHLWADSLGVLTTALEISQISASRDGTLESEILLMMGKVQKMMVYLGGYETRAAAITFIRAIKMSYVCSHDLGLMRQAYLEIALTYLKTIDLTIKADSSIFPIKDIDYIVLSSKNTFEQRLSSPLGIINTPKGESENQKERRAVWLAIRCAVAVAYAQRSRNVIIGNKRGSSKNVEAKAINRLPEFVSMDLLNRNVLGKEQKVYKNEIEEELAPLIESQEVKVNETYYSQVNKIKTAASILSWIHLLGYQNVLQRLVNTATFSVLGEQANGCSDLDSLCKANLKSGMNHDVVRYMLHSGELSTRLTVMHNFLCVNLSAYTDECCAPHIPGSLILPNLSDNSKITMKSYAANNAMNFDEDPKSGKRTATVSLPPGSNLDMPKPDDQISFLQAELELSIQWYQSGLDEDKDHESATISLLFAFADTEHNFALGTKRVALHKLHELHDKLVLLALKVDIYAIVRNEPKNVSSFSKSKNEESKNTFFKKDQHKQLETLFQQCLDEAWNLIKGTPRQRERTYVEFNIDNAKNLESTFDPNLGITLRGTVLLTWLFKLLT